MTLDFSENGGETSAVDGERLAVLFAWFSHGLETAANGKRVADEQDLAHWIAQVLKWGSGWTDAVLLTEAHMAAALNDKPRLVEVAALAAALAPSRERFEETMTQGRAFHAAAAAGWPNAVLSWPTPVVALPVVAGAAAARIGAPLDQTLLAYLNALATNLIAAGIRLSLCGQFGGVRVLAHLMEVITAMARRATSSTLDDLGACALGAEIESMNHERLTVRLFIS
jgi:urease accessory protein